MNRPNPSIDLAVAIALGAVLFALVIAYLYAQPDPATGRVVSVDTDGNITD